jgi:primase-polymerase (primpol)-like protein
MTLGPQNSIADSPPQPIEVCPEGIPVELKKRPQWINWKYAWNGKKWTKHPYDPRSDRKASSTDLMTWCTFEEAVAALKTGKYDGVGFVFCSADPFVGVDLDECRDPETGKIEEWAQKILERFEDAVHVEVSPSGEGVHLITRGVRKEGVNTKRVEVYGQDRYFTITGVAL